jgi:hypothetical protein
VFSERIQRGSKAHDIAVVVVGIGEFFLVDLFPPRIVDAKAALPTTAYAPLVRPDGYGSRGNLPDALFFNLVSFAKGVEKLALRQPFHLANPPTGLFCGEYPTAFKTEVG